MTPTDRLTDDHVYLLVNAVRQRLTEGASMSEILSSDLLADVDSAMRLTIAEILPTLVSETSAASGEISRIDALALRMSARGHSGLLTYIRKIGFFDLSKRIRELEVSDFGSECLLFLARDTDHSGRRVAIKVPFVDYSQPLSIDTDQLSRRRRRFLHEAAVLRKMNGTALPELVDAVIKDNPLFPRGIPPSVRGHEVFVVMQFVRGTRVDLQARQYHRDGRPCCATHLALQFGTAFLLLQQEIAARLGTAWYYTDIKPENAIASDVVRVVDAASIYSPEDETPPRRSDLYLSPEDLRRSRSTGLVPDDGYVCRSVARGVQILACNSSAVVGDALPPWAGHVSKEVCDAIDHANASPLRVDEFLRTLRALLPRVDCGHQRSGSSAKVVVNLP
jgi:hypothetical protein